MIQENKPVDVQRHNVQCYVISEDDGVRRKGRVNTEQVLMIYWC